MTEPKFTDEEIKKALECHIKRQCWNDCPNATEERQLLSKPCSQMIAEDALALINRYEAQIYRLKEDIEAQDSSISSLLDIVNSNYQKGRTDATKEFAERLMNKSKKRVSDVYGPRVYIQDVLDLEKEMMKEQE